MSASTKGWLNGVKAHLVTALPAADIVRGERDGVNHSDKDLVAVWWSGFDELTRDTALGSSVIRLRYFPRRSSQPDDAAPDNPDPLLDAADALRDAFPRPTTRVVGFFTPGLACRLTNVKPNYDRDVWRVEAELVSYELGVTG